MTTNSNTRFGHKVWCDIQVVEPVKEAEPVKEVEPVKEAAIVSNLGLSQMNLGKEQAD